MKTNNYYKLLLLFLLLPPLFYYQGCGMASTHLSGFISPDYKGEPIKKIMIYFAVNEIEVRQVVEDEVVQSFNNSNYNAISSLKLFPPTKDYTKDELSEKIQNEKIDAVLFVELSNYTTNQTYIPKSEVYNFGKKTVTKNEYGGYNVNKPVASINAYLIDVKRDYNIWVASSTTGGNAFAKYATLASSFGDEVVKDLVSKGILK